MTGNKYILEDLRYIIEAPVSWKILSNKTVLITGANGFLPSYMVETLLFLIEKKIISKSKIICLVRNKGKANVRFKSYLNNRNLKFVYQDVCDPINLEEKVDFIIHAASQASPKYYGIDPVGTLVANSIGTYNLLKFARGKDVEGFLYFSSSEVYGAIEGSQQVSEDDFGYLNPMKVRSCYAESKRMGETICVSWNNQYGVPVKIVRPFHTYGPGMALDDGRVYADFVSDILFNRNITLNSDGSAIRAFCYIADATIAFFMVLLSGRECQAYNVGNPDCEISMIDLARRLISFFPEKQLSISSNVQSDEVNYIKSQVSRISPDISKIKNDLGWNPDIDINEGFMRTILSYDKK